MSISLSAVSLYVLNFKPDTLDHHYSTTENIILHTFFICDSVRSVVALLQCLLFSNEISTIIAMFDRLDAYFVQYFQHRICYRQFKHSIRWRTLTVVGVCLLYILQFLLRLQLGDHTTSRVNLHSKFLQFVTALCYLHHIFYIELLSFHLAQLNLVIVRDASAYADRAHHASAFQRICNHLKSYKTVHFRFYTIALRMNKYFGLSLIAVLLHAFSDLIYSAFWAFQAIHGSSGSWALWSK